MRGRGEGRFKVAVVALAAAIGAVLAVPAAAGAVVFTNPAPITVPPFGAATPYPSSISVSGFISPITDVNVTTHNLNYARPEELRLLVVGPTGAALALQEFDVAAASPPDAAAGVNTTFDDAAAAFLPSSAAWTSGSFKPTNYVTPARPHQPPAPATFSIPGPIAGSANLANVFNGTDPNGVWNLFAFDTSTRLGGGEITGGWSLDITQEERGRCRKTEATILGTADGNRIQGTPGDDVIQARRGKDIIKGLGGDDLICGARGKDRIFGNQGDDVLIGGAESDFLNGGSGDNRIFGGTPKAPDRGANNVCPVGEDDKSSHCEEK